MAITNQERVGKAMDLLRQGLAPYIEREFRNVYQEGANAEAARFMAGDRNVGSSTIVEWDVYSLLKLMWESWNAVFGKTLGRAERSLVQELRDWRNDWAHQKPFSSDDADRALDSASRMLTAISAPQADEVGRMKMELRRLIFDEQVRSEKKKAGGSLVEAAAAGALKPWREVVTPHIDVASGNYQQAEFAADLWQVHLGEGSDEYRKPVEFFRRTYLTESLRKLLVNSVRRLTGKGGDPVVQLQTNFGGGKTHSILALLHLFSGAKAAELPGVETVLAESGTSSLPEVNIAVLVGNKISPGNPAKKTDGTVVATLWGELAYQLGGRKAYERLRADDENATNPGDALRELFNEHAPCLVLIDEWVAYARQLHDDKDLPGGDFETMFTFAQTLTEAAKTAQQCLLVISLPASDTTGSPHTQTDDVEVGGIRGREALDRLRNVVGRVESSWRPATAEEGFEIVRRRLFEPMPGSDAYKYRDVTARAFSELYEAQKTEFPPEARGMEYEKRIRAAYPIHPEIFDRLYTDWSTLVKFQRTRGVLRLMAAAIHSLWERGDRSPLILPSTIPIDDPRVQTELTRYLSDNWVPIIEKDVDGPGSLPRKIDAEITNLGKQHATRRVARTIYLGSAPTSSAAHRGIEDRRIKLGCVMPGESPAVFGDALRRLAAAATYLYQDGTRAWYATQPTVTKLAEDRAEQLRREPDRVAHEVEKRVRADVKATGDFSRIHALPLSGQDIPDDRDARLVLLGIDHPYSKEPDNAAERAAREILEMRGSSPRLYRNTLVFIAPDKIRLEDLEDAVRRFLAWESIVAESDQLNIDPQQVKQAENQRTVADMLVNSRLPETYQWLVVPEQRSPEAEVTLQTIRLSGQGSLAARAGRKLRSDELLITSLAGTRLRMELDRIPLWRGNHVSVRQLAEDFARYLYLPRLADPSVLTAAIQDGASLLTWETETFAFADDYDDATGRYRGVRVGQAINLPDADARGVVVKPDAARIQLDAEKTHSIGGTPGMLSGSSAGVETAFPGSGGNGGVPQPPEPVKPTRFHGTADLDPARVGLSASRIAEEVIAHISGLVGAEVRVTLEIEASVPSGVPDTIVRVVTENSRTLKFSTHGFERE